MVIFAARLFYTHKNSIRNMQLVYSEAMKLLLCVPRYYSQHKYLKYKYGAHERSIIVALVNPSCTFTTSDMLV